MKTPVGAIGLLSLVILPSLLFAAAPAVPPPPAVDGRAHVLMDAATGKLLAAENENERLEPASLTKLMTVYTIFHALKAGQLHLDDKVVVSEHAWREGGAGSGGSTMFLPIHGSTTLENMLKGVIIQSGNDASIAVAEHLSGSEEAFSDVMNRHARELGLKHSHFINSTGLPDPEHYTSALDVAILSRALINEFPEYYAWFSQKEFVFNGIKQGNRNLLLYRDSSVDGIKTGHTQAAGYCLAASAKRGDMRMITVVMGTGSAEARTKASLELLNYGFRHYETQRLYQAGKQVVEARVWKGATETVGLGVPADVWVTVPRGSLDTLKATPEAPRDLVAPLDPATPVGSLKLSLGGEPLLESPLVPLTAVAEGSLWRRAMDTVLLWFE
ncbi:MAG: D-alanyl-D-alanine carboxypeptidase [Gammaproteobacteria bacterium]|nr:D-alanyl-D-alanine carboxypeptidase [Gammaproteobacteria bacterium]